MAAVIGVAATAWGIPSSAVPDTPIVRADEPVGWYGTASWEYQSRLGNGSALVTTVSVSQTPTGSSWQASIRGLDELASPPCPSAITKYEADGSGANDVRLDAVYSLVTGTWEYTIVGVPGPDVPWYTGTASGVRYQTGECLEQQFADPFSYPITFGRYGSAQTDAPPDTFVVIGSVTGTLGPGTAYTHEWALRRADCTDAPDFDDDGYDDCVEVDAESDPFDENSTPETEDDSDGDGVPDGDDVCEGTPAGVPVDELGCPQDTDGDGVADDVDRCEATAPGTPVNVEGCTDNDRDGIADEDDRCPFVPGSPENEGCLADDADFDGIPDVRDNCLITWNPDQLDSDEDGIGDACEPIVAVDDTMDDNVVDLGESLVMNVLDNDVGDGLQVVDAERRGHDEGSLGFDENQLNWGYRGVQPGIYEFEYTIRDQYFRTDTATVTVRVGCVNDERRSLSMDWTARTDYPGLPDQDFFHLNADVRFCTDGSITDFTLTPTVDDSTDTALGVLGFDLQTGPVEYSPPQDTYPALTVAASTVFSVCFSPATLFRVTAGAKAKSVWERTVDRVLTNSTRRNAPWTTESLRTALEAGRDATLVELQRSLRRLLPRRVADDLFEAVEEEFKIVFNRAIGQIERDAGPLGLIGKTPDEVALLAWNHLFQVIVEATTVCSGLEAWKPEVVLESRPLLGPLQPAAPDGYLNPFLAVE